MRSDSSPAPQHLFRAYLGWFLAPLLAAVSILAMALAGIWGQITSDSWWIVEGYRLKTEAALAKPSPKLVVLGGSGAYFGIRARQLQQASGMPAVNFGMHAGLPFSYLAYRAKGALRPGDLVLLTLEYAYYGAMPGDGPDIANIVNTLIASTALASDPAYLRELTPGAAVELIRHIKPERIRDGWRARLDGYANPGGYQLDGLDAWGDETRDYRSPADAERLRQALATASRRGLPVIDPDGAHFREIRAFVDWCRNHGVTVMATWPNTIMAAPFMGPDFERTQAGIVAAYRGLGVPVIGRPEDARLPAELFFDTHYHLTPGGADLRTTHLATALCAETTLCRRPVTSRP